MTTDANTSLQTYLDNLKLDYTPTFIKTPQTGDLYQSPRLHWSIALSKGREAAVFPYTQGVGHVIGYKQFFKLPFDKRAADACYRKTCETGKLYMPNPSDPDSPFRAIGTQPTPALADVLYCLVQDASVRQYTTYESWAQDYGYNPDSRKGESVYRQCQSQTTSLILVLGGGKCGAEAIHILETLEELFSGY